MTKHDPSESYVPVMADLALSPAANQALHDLEKAARTREPYWPKPQTPPAWIDVDRIITRNSDGGTTAWSRKEADQLSRALIVLIDRLKCEPEA